MKGNSSIVKAASPEYIGSVELGFTGVHGVYLSCLAELIVHWSWSHAGDKIQSFELILEKKSEEGWFRRKGGGVLVGVQWSLVGVSGDLGCCVAVGRKENGFWNCYWWSEKKGKRVMVLILAGKNGVVCCCLLLLGRVVGNNSEEQRSWVW
ncbi:hypothetical protein H5410_021223 [Solanum commersonii]|uniref:Uncharacterized protein n=1 Tax=Solanum commersonii TaxID=4109 RepID=A0A9J5ZGI6_SOLCO|nr:hypothetical protein H5410_021223 [Solanum commersonii]